MKTMKLEPGDIVLVHPHVSIRVHKLTKMEDGKLFPALPNHDVVHPAIVVHQYPDGTVILSAFASDGFPYGVNAIAKIIESEEDLRDPIFENMSWVSLIPGSAPWYRNVPPPPIPVNSVVTHPLGVVAMKVDPPPPPHPTQSGAVVANPNLTDPLGDGKGPLV